MSYSTTYNNLINSASSYLSKQDVDLIQKAYKQAKKIHDKELRFSGEPYIDHPLTVAYYIAEERLDAHSIAASLLHDTLENSDTSLENIRRDFGDDVALLVDGLTKLNKVHIKSSYKFPFNIIDKITGKEKENFEKHVDNLRKMTLAMTKDVRVILIKLADRLHNMKTLKYLPKDRQAEFAQETIEIYAPLANRLGMGELKGELEDLAFPYIYPEQYKKTKKISSQYFPKKEDYIDKFIKILKNYFSKHNINIHIHGRKKHLYSLWKKMSRYDNDITKIYDLVAVRIVVKDNEECYKVLGMIHKKYKPLVGRIKDYIALPKPNGYQSLHTTVFGPEGEIVEIQIRTWEMHEKAEFGIAAHWHYKTSPDIKNQLNIPKQQIEWLDEMAHWHEQISDPKEWTKGLKMDFFHDQIFVYTPKGDVTRLPSGSTPVDFAYSVHSEIGNRCIGAKINGKLTRLNHMLENGDIVTILLSKNPSKPKKDWLKFVKSTRAKDCIKNYFQK